MRLIVEFAGYVVMGTILFGLVLGFFLLRAYIYQPRSIAPHPPHKEPPDEALKAGRAALEQVKRRYFQAAGRQKDRLGLELRRLEKRMQRLEQQYGEDQSDYLYACKRREVAWLNWKEVHDQAAYRGRKIDPETRELLKEAEDEYYTLHRKVEEEWHKVVARDLVNLEELRGQEVFTQSPTAAAGEPEPEAEEGPTPDAMDAAPREEPPAGEPGEPEPTAIPEAEPPQVPPGDGGVLRQEDFRDPNTPKADRRYLDPAFDLAFTGDGVLRGADLSGVDFSGVVFQGLHLHQNGRFTNGRLAGVVLEPQEKPHRFVGCDFSGADLSGSRLNHAIFSRCDFSRTRWGEAHLERVKFVACPMTGVAWDGCDLSRTVMSPEMLEALDFSTAAAPPHNAQAAGQPVPTPEAGAPDAGATPAPDDLPEEPSEPSHGGG